MLDCSPDNLRREIEDAIRLRSVHTDLSQTLVRRYAGPSYRKDWGDQGVDMHENHGFEWTTNMVPNLVYTNPKVGVTHDSATDDHEEVAATRDGLNNWVEAVDFVQPMEAIATDLQFDFGVAIVTAEPHTVDPSFAVYTDQLAGAAGTQKSVRPAVYRLSPRRFFMDPQATSPSNVRFMGHIWIEDKDDLLGAKGPTGKPKYDRKAIEACGVDAGLDEIRSKSDMPAEIHGTTRNQIVGYEVYVPETGLIYTLGYGSQGGAGKGEGVFLRPPRKYVGTATGPYVLFGAYLVPDQLYPLSPLMVSAYLNEEINAHAGQASDDAGSAKQFQIVDGPDVSKAITTAANGTVVCVPNFSGRTASVRIGGANPENLEYIKFLRERLDRMTGITDAVSGNVTGATAEEVHTAQANRNVRVKFLQAKFRRGVVQVLTIVASQMWHNPAVRFAVKTTDPSTGEQKVGMFQGGQREDGSGLLFNGLRIKIEPYSMEAVDELTLQRNMQSFGSMVAQAAPAMIQFPFLKWREWANDQGETLNIKDGGDRYIDFDMLKKAQQLTSPALFGMQPPMQPGAPGQAPGAPGAPGQPQGPQMQGAPQPPNGPVPGNVGGGPTDAQIAGAQRRGMMQLAG